MYGGSGTPAPAANRRTTGLLAWVSANKKEIMLLLGAVLVLAGLVICTLFFTGPTTSPTRYRSGRPEPGAFGIKWAQHSYFALGAALAALGALGIVAGQVLRDKALMAAVGLLVTIVSAGSVYLLATHFLLKARAAAEKRAETARQEIAHAIYEAKVKTSRPVKPLSLLDTMRGYSVNTSHEWSGRKVGKEAYLVRFAPTAKAGEAEYFEVNLKRGTVRRTVRPINDPPEPSPAPAGSIWNVGEPKPQADWSALDTAVGLTPEPELTAGKVAGLIFEFFTGWALWYGMLCFGGWIASKIRKAPSGDWYKHALWIAVIPAGLALLRHLPY